MTPCLGQRGRCEGFGKHSRRVCETALWGEAPEKPCVAQRVEGAALECIRRPGDICLIAPSGQRMSQRAAPGNNPARCIYPWLSIRSHPGYRPANRWVVPGSRLFSHVSAGLVMRRKLARVPRYTPKRLPPDARKRGLSGAAPDCRSITHNAKSSRNCPVFLRYNKVVTPVFTGVD
jgi:hypothetical protein